MNKINSSTVKEFVTIVPIILVAVTLPLPVLINNIAIGVLIIYWIFNFKKTKISLIYTKWLLLIPIGLFALTLAGLTNTENLSDGLKVVEKSLPLLIIPLIIGSLHIKKQKEAVLYSIGSFAIIILIMSVIFVIKYLVLLESIDPSLNDPISKIAPYAFNYFAFHVAFVLLSVTVLWAFSDKQLSALKKVLLSLMILILFLTLILLASKMAIIAVVIGLIFLFYYKFGFIISVMGTVVLVGLIAVLVFSIPATKTRFNALINQEFKFKRNNSAAQNSITMRTEKWKCATEIIKENIFFGVGTGDAHTYLDKCYKENKFWGWLKSYNTHNQYLDYGVKYGIVGLLLILSIIVIPAYTSFRHKDILFLLLIVFVSIIFISENVLSRQKGMVFFSLFYSLLANHLQTKTNTHDK